MVKKDGYIKIYNFLNEKFNQKKSFTIKDLVEFTKLKEGTWNTRLKNLFIDVKEAPELYATSEIKNNSQKDFLRYMSQKNRDEKKEKLIKHSNQAIISAIELHNKPQITYRYQIVVILIINAWELALKAYYFKKENKENNKEKVLKDDGRPVKTFNELLSYIASNCGKDILPTIENLKNLYKYRNKFIHHYNDNYDMILFLLIKKSVIFYNKFLFKYFNMTLEALEDFEILPIGFKKSINPIDLFSKKSSSNKNDDFYKSLIKSTEDLNEKGIEASIFAPFPVSFMKGKDIKKFHVKTNADIIARITKDQNEADATLYLDKTIRLADENEKGAQAVYLEEEKLFGKGGTYPLTLRGDIIPFCKKEIEGFKVNRKFYDFMKELKEDPKYSRGRLSSMTNPKSPITYFFKEEIKDKLVSLYKKN